MHRIRTLIASFTLAFVSHAGAAVSYFNPTGPTEVSVPFSEAVRVDNTLYLSGQVGLNHKTHKLAVGGIQGETRQAMENISQVLTDHGYQFSQVVKCTVFLSNIDDFPAFNEVYKTFFRIERLPARSTVAVKSLSMKAKVEIECLAAK